MTETKEINKQTEYFIDPLGDIANITKTLNLIQGHIKLNIKANSKQSLTLCSLNLEK